MISSSLHESLNIHLQFDKDKIPWLEGSVRAVFVCLYLHDVPSSMKVLLQNLLHEFALFEPLFQSRNLAS